MRSSGEAFGEADDLDVGPVQTLRGQQRPLEVVRRLSAGARTERRFACETRPSQRPGVVARLEPVVGHKRRRWRIGLFESARRPRVHDTTSCDRKPRCCDDSCRFVGEPEVVAIEYQGAI